MAVLWRPARSAHAASASSLLTGLAATETDLGKIAARVAAGRLKDPDKIGVAAGKIISKRKVAKHFI